MSKAQVVGFLHSSQAHLRSTSVAQPGCLNEAQRDIYSDLQHEGATPKPKTGRGCFQCHAFVREASSQRQTKGQTGRPGLVGARTTFRDPGRHVQAARDT